MERLFYIYVWFSGSNEEENTQNIDQYPFSYLKYPTKASFGKRILRIVRTVGIRERI
jgi:hypothetical protein